MEIMSLAHSQLDTRVIVQDKRSLLFTSIYRKVFHLMSEPIETHTVDAVKPMDRGVEFARSVVVICWWRESFILEERLSYGASTENELGHTFRI